ncbi:hypothetical protein POM88_009684 [Heracleum sosnowskyi]|uniref:RNase H type-1 domain-containing protein n=1 Tax=Heracleum sosnowskyi TaxID=360622 RepID=A0AAD8JBY2_9APIA|nr:hypothetical protein POM88_009684 [Heracleum sosnowskyi]
MGICGIQIPRGMSSRIHIIDGEENVRDHVLCGYTDDAFKMSSDQKILSGMGGFINDSQGKLIYIFSRPSDAFGTFHAELTTIDFLMKAMEKSDKSMTKIRMHLDSVEVFNLLLRIKAGLVHKLELVDASFKELVRNNNFDFRIIHRSFNLGADDLAKLGLSRNCLIQG